MALERTGWRSTYAQDLLEGNEVTSLDDRCKSFGAVKYVTCLNETTHSEHANMWPVSLFGKSRAFPIKSFGLSLVGIKL